MTSSLSNFFYSLIAGGVVVTVITAAVVFVSKTDRLKRS